MLLAPAPRVWAASDGAALYHNYCSVCHGDKGDGKSRATGSLSTLPRDFTSAAARQTLSRERIAAVISHGVAGTAMVGWKAQLSPADVDVLAEHVHTRFVLGQGAAGVAGGGAATTAPPSAAISGTRAHGGREADAPAARSAGLAGPAAATGSTPARVDMTVGLPNGLKGDSRRGGAFYLANCATCHGTRGDGQGPRAYFINPKPRNFGEADSRARFNRLVLFAAVSEGRLASEMPAWNKVATPQQMADVAEYVFQAFILGRPPALPGTAQAAPPTVAR
ncbi:MAG: c-type cytochrome [Rubrivivax sp.]|nr:c-type cytochrome [Rubrivivax sp.]